jgi:hypothetical protein
MPLRRNQSERSYTQSIWLTDPPPETVGKNSDENQDTPPTQPPPRKPPTPTPLFRRISERTGLNLSLSTTPEIGENEDEGKEQTRQPPLMERSRTPTTPSTINS